MAISGLSMAALTYPVSDPAEQARAMQLLGTRYPEYAAFPMPKPEEILILLRVVPKVLSVLDFERLWAQRSAAGLSELPDSALIRTDE